MRLLRLLALSLCFAGAANATLPNIIVILADDLAIGGLSAYGTGVGGLTATSPTPNIDQLAADGVRFTNAFVPPLCAPSRATLYTGRYPFSHGMSNNGTPPADIWTQQNIPHLLQLAGYKTALIGKSHLGIPPLSNPWDHFDVCTTVSCDYDNTEMQSDGSAPSTRTGYVTTLLEGYAETWIGSINHATDPFFLVLAEKAPHAPHVPASADDHSLDASSPTNPATYGDLRTGRSAQVQAYANVVYGQLWGTWTAGDYQVARPTGYGKDAYTGGATPTERKQWVTPQLQKDYVETIKELDRTVGLLRAYLTAQSLASNTIIIFMSDNGYMVADHSLYDKQAPYIQSIQIPLVMAGPGISAGQVKSEFVHSTDISATILDIANVSQPADVYGRTLFDIVPTLTGAAWRTNLLLWGPWGYHATSPAVTAWYGLINSNYVFIDHYDSQGGITPAYELIDRNADPTELTNVYDDPAYLGTRETLRAQLRALLISNGLPSWHDTRMTSP